MNANRYPRQRGFTLIEVVISSAIFTIGLLGIAALQAGSLRLTQAAVQHDQASIMAADMADRIRSNPAGAAHYDGFDSADFDSPIQAPDCGTHPCNPEELARHDLAHWRQTGDLPGIRGLISRREDYYTVTLIWQPRLPRPPQSREQLPGIETRCSADQAEDSYCLSLTFPL